MKATTTLLFCLGLWSGISTAASAYAVEPSVRPKLIAMGEMAAEASLVKVNDRIYQAFGYDFSNIYFVEGDDGIIVIDSDWAASSAARANGNDCHLVSS